MPVIQCWMGVGGIPAESPSAKRDRLLWVKTGRCPVATRMGVSVRPSRRCHSSERKTGLDATGLDARNHGVSGAEPPIGPELPERVEQVRAALSDADRVRFEQDLE